MIPPPSPDRYFVALPARRGQTFTRDELFQLLKERKLSPRVMVAPVNTSDWKKLHDLFPEWSPPAARPVEPPAPPGEVASQPWQEAPEPPFRSKENGFDLIAFLMMGLGVICLFAGLAGCTAKRSGEIVFGNMLFNLGLWLLLVAVFLKVLARILASNEASVRALNHLISLQEAKLTFSNSPAAGDAPVEAAAPDGAGTVRAEAPPASSGPG